MAVGGAAGPLFGLLLGLLHGVYNAALGHAATQSILGLPFQGGYTNLGIIVGMACGMVVGTVLDVRAQRRVHQDMA
jgi:hypothetical protein